MRTRALIGAAILLLLGSTTAFSRAVKEGELRVGTLMAYTGGLKEYGPAINTGAELAAKQLNEAGLAVELITEDTGTDPTVGVTSARKLVDIDGVHAIVGALSSGITMPVAEAVTIPSGVLLISPASTAPAITDLPADRGRDFLFRTAPPDGGQGAVAGQLAADEGATTIAVLYINNAYGLGLAEAFKESFEAAGGMVTAMVPVEANAASYTAELRRALADDPDVLAAYSYPAEASIFLKEAIEFFDYDKFLFADGTKSMDLLEAVGPWRLEGSRGTAPASMETDSLAMYNEAYEAEYGELSPLPFITNAYDATAVIGLAAQAAVVDGVAVSSESIRDRLRMVANPPGEVIRPGEFARAFELLAAGQDINYEGAAGTADFDDAGDTHGPIEIWEYSGGRIKTVAIVQP